MHSDPRDLHVLTHSFPTRRSSDLDRITAIDGQPVGYFDDIGPMIQDLGGQGGEVMVEVEREGQRLALPIPPRLASQAGRGDFWMLGIEPVRRSEPPHKAAVEDNGPTAAARAAPSRVRCRPA